MRRIMLVIFAALAASLSARAGGDKKDDNPYLNKEGRLAQALEVRDLGGGFAGFTGTMWKIETSGARSRGQVFNEKVTPEKKGELSKDEVAALAKELVKYDLFSLPKQENKATGANPLVVEISFGDRKFSLTQDRLKGLPKPDANNPKASVPGRFAGILDAVREMIDKKDKK